MKVYCMESYRIRHNCGRSEPTGSYYIARNGKKKEVMKYVNVYDTAVGEFLPEDWKAIVRKCVEEAGAMELLGKIIEHCRTHCVWLKNDKEREEYALEILVGRSYRAWKDFSIGGAEEGSAFVFEFSEEEMHNGFVWEVRPDS